MGLEDRIQPLDEQKLSGLVFTIGISSGLSGAYWLGREGLNRGERIGMALLGPILATMANADLALLYPAHPADERDILTLATLYGAVFLSYLIGRVRRRYAQWKGEPFH